LHTPFIGTLHEPLPSAVIHIHPPYRQSFCTVISEQSHGVPVWAETEASKIANITVYDFILFYYLFCKILNLDMKGNGQITFGNSLIYFF